MNGAVVNFLRFTTFSYIFMALARASWCWSSVRGKKQAGVLLDLNLHLSGLATTGKWGLYIETQWGGKQGHGGCQCVQEKDRLNLFLLATLLNNIQVTTH